jgi:hypothetical protein
MREISGKTAMPTSGCHGKPGRAVVTLRTKRGRMGSLDEAASASTHEVSRLLRAWGLGDDSALERLMPLVYNELHRLAHRYMAGEQPGQTLQTTALVHEVYLRLVDANDIDWQNRAHFYGLCARLMRRILIDFARSRNYQKRGGHFPHIELEEAATVFCGCGLGTLGGG